MRSKRIAAWLLILTSVLLTGIVSPLPAYAKKNSEISDFEQRISANKEKIKKLEEESAELKSEVNRLEGLKTDAAEYIADLDRRKEELNEDILLKQQEIAETEAKITVLEAELQAAEDKVEEQKISMSSRIRYMYESEHSGFLDRLFQSENFAGILNNFEYIGKITDFDRKKLDEFKDAVSEKNLKLEELESEKAVLTAAEESLDAEMISLKELSEKKEAELKAYDVKISEAGEKSEAIVADVGKLKAAIKEEENRIAAIEAEEKRKEEEARKKAEQEKKAYKAVSIGDISFQWPVPSSGRVTSVFGSREAPVDGASTNHKGIDIGAAEGSDILAAEKGTVVISTYSESAGNYVMISHGGGIYTVYMHMSKRLVNADDTVRKGQLIGYVGSTGYSTGPHLHFGIRVNGDYVDPQLYVSR